MINWSNLVNLPCQQAFAQPATINPIVSQPGAPAYACRGVWTNRPVEIMTDQGGYHSTNQPVLGIRIAEFVTRPLQGDQITTAGILYHIVDTQLDGQGGCDLMLRMPSQPSV